MNKKTLIIFSIIFILIIVIIFIYVQGIQKKSKPSDNLNNNTDINQGESNQNLLPTEEVELTDIYIKKDISSKASIMLTDGWDDTEEEIAEFSNPYSDKIINLDSNDKLRIILNHNYVNGKFTKITVSDINNKINDIYSKYYYMDSPERVVEHEYSIIDGTIIEKDYKNIFNTNLIVPTDKVGACPFYYYSNSNTYFVSHDCGGTAYPTINFYKQKYTTKGNNIYVYVSVAMYHAADQGKVYSDIEHENVLYNASSNDQVVADLKTNPQKYGQYKLIFEKNSDGLYYYQSAEKIN